MRTGWFRRPDRGSVSVEVAILAPAFIGLIILAGVTGRIAIASEAVDTAAHDAARSASIARDAGSARAGARTAARQRLDWEGLSCAGEPDLAFDGTVDGQPATFDAAFGSAPGQDATVSVTVTCVVSFRDLRTAGLPGIPAERTIRATFVSPLDRYRSRALGPADRSAGSPGHRASDGL